MKHDFSDADFRAFLFSDALLARRSDWERTLAAWKSADQQAEGRRMLDDVPANARIRAEVEAMIKPQTNSFVFERACEPPDVLYLDPQRTRERSENTVVHELRHSSLASVKGETEKLLGGRQPLGQRAVDYRGAFGAGLATLAAAGGAEGPGAASITPPPRGGGWPRGRVGAGLHLLTSPCTRTMREVCRTSPIARSPTPTPASTSTPLTAPWHG